MTARTIVVLAGLAMAGLSAGLFFGWSVSVIPGLLRTSDATYISTMQNINVAIVNPPFVAVFLGTPIVLTAAAVMHLRIGDERRAWLLFGAVATYVVGLLGITFGANVPLNNALDQFDLAASSTSQVVEQRAAYEGPWNRWHHIRTTAAVTAFLLAASVPLVTESE